MKIDSVNSLINTFPIVKGIFENNSGNLYRAYELKPLSVGIQGNDESLAHENLSIKIHEAILGLKDHHHLQLIIQREKDKKSELTSLTTNIFIFEKIKNKKQGTPDFAKSLKECGIEIQPLSENTFRSLLFRYFQVDSDSNCLPDLAWESDHLISNEKKIGVANLTELPTRTWASCLKNVFSLPFEFIASIHLKVPDKTKIRKTLGTKRRVSHVLSFHNNHELKNIESESTLSSSEEQLERITTGGEELLNLSMGFIFWAGDKNSLQDKLDALVRVGSNTCDAGFFAEELGVLESFKAHLPCEQGLTVREHPILSKNLSHTLPLSLDYYREDKSLGGPHVVSKPLEKSTLNLFSPENLNFNGFICGASGAGKSFLMNSVIDAFLKDEPTGRVMIFDVGGSYRKIMPELGGQAINLDSEAAKTLILEFLSKQVFKVDGFSKTVIENFCGAGAHITHSHSSAIESALIDLSGRHFLLSKIQKYFAAKSDSVSQDIALWLKPFLPWEKLDNSQDKEIFSEKNCLSYDFKNLDGEPLLQRLAILCLTQKLWQELSLNSQQGKTLIIFDEVWRFFSHSQSFLNEFYRTLRKYGAGIVSITQNISDYGNSNFAKTVLSNSYTKILLQGGASNRLLGDLLDLSDDEKKKALSVSSRKGVFSEFFVLTPRFRQIMRLYPTQRLYDLANTENIQGSQHMEAPA